MMLLTSVTQFLVSLLSQGEGVFCKHVELVNNELLLCGAREGGLMGE
jgi:hypothetical protein